MVKIRLWDNIVREMCYPEDIIDEFLTFDGRVMECDFSEWTMSDVSDEYDVMLSSDVKDANGIDIYDRDVVARNPVDVGVIHFKEGTFWWVNVKDDLLHPLHELSHSGAFKLEVIGNLYEDAHLTL